MYIFYVFMLSRKSRFFSWLLSLNDLNLCLDVHSNQILWMQVKILTAGYSLCFGFCLCRQNVNYLEFYSAIMKKDYTEIFSDKTRKPRKTKQNKTESTVGHSGTLLSHKISISPKINFQEDLMETNLSASLKQPHKASRETTKPKKHFISQQGKLEVGGQEDQPYHWLGLEDASTAALSLNF